MLQLDDDTLEDLREYVDFNIDNLQDPACTLEYAGRFYEEASEALRAHAILSLLLHADGAAFSSGLVASGHARRAFLLRCARQQYADFYVALSRSGAMLDAVVGNDLSLAGEIFGLSPPAYRKGDEYEDDFQWQCLLGLLLTGAPRPELDDTLGALEKATDGEGERLEVARALLSRDAEAFDEAFRALVSTQQAVNEEEDASDEEPAAAAGVYVFIEGVAVLKVARRLGIRIEPEYPLCPTLALLDQAPAQPRDAFALP
jgi:hypothetical protein